MNASPKSRSRPWLWFGLICLTSLILAFVGDRQGGYTDACVGLAALYAWPALMGWVGGYYGKWTITLAGALAILIAVMIVPVFFSRHGAPRMEYSAVFGLSVSVVVMLFISALVHRSARRFRRRQPLPGHCRRCRRDLQFRVDQPCPRCWEPVLCQKCGYILTGNVSGICPECETAVPKP